MNLNWLTDYTVYLTVHGSQAYGLNHELSDLDIKGVCIPPRGVRDHLFQGFDQAENAPEINGHQAVLPRINPLNPKVESTVYSLRKFFKLAADVNPNVIELLYTSTSDHLKSSPVWEHIVQNRGMFLSSKAKFTFSGYAVAQLNKIKRHRKWLLSPIKEKPLRADYGLPETQPVAIETITREIRRLVEEWNFHQYRLDELERSELKERCWELVARLSTNKTVGWDNWPDEYWKVAIAKLQSELNLSDSLTAVISREHDYRKDVQAYESYSRWERERNPERKALEAKYQYDVKHGMHLVRLLRMGIEILETGSVIVKRPDADELIEVRRGLWSYERLLEYSANLEAQLDLVYSTTKLPRAVDQLALNGLYQYTLAVHDHNQA